MTTNAELIAALRAAVEATPDSRPLLEHLATLLVEAERFAEAAEIYRRVLDLAPEDDDVRLALARAYYRAGESDVAAVVLERLVEGPRPAPEVFLLLARVHLALGAPERAAQAYQRALAADPELADLELQSRLTVEAPEAPLEEVRDELVFVVAEEAEAAVDDPVERPRIDFDDVGGMEEVKEQIRLKIIYPLTHPEIYHAYGQSTGGGILLYGPPGCGKTYLARATAGEVRLSFLSVGLHDVLDMYIGQSERNLHALFELARDRAPCVLFFDEVDALGASRSDMRYSAGRKIINQFLAELDGVDTSNEGILILAATNAPWHVDSAIRRPGRFDRVLFVPPPDAAARAAILRLMLADKPVERIDYQRLARQTEDFSGADLRSVVDTAVERKLREAMRTGVPQPLRTRDLQAVIKAVHPTTKEWLATARNYAVYANEGGLYDEVLDYLKVSGGASSFL